MIECRHGPRFALEAAPQLGVRGNFRRQDLDRHHALESRVARPIDLAHAARPIGAPIS